MNWRIRHNDICSLSMKAKLLILQVILFGLLTVRVAQANQWGEITADEWSFEPTPEMNDPAAIVLFDHGEMRIAIEGISLERHVRIKVFDRERAASVLPTSVWTFEGDKMSEVKSQTILQTGGKIKARKGNVRVRRMGSFRIDSLSFPDLEDGCIVEYHYLQSHERFQLLDPWFFQSKLYTVSSVISVSLTPGFKYLATTRAVPDENQKARQQDVKRGEYQDEARYTYEVPNIPPAIEEPFAGFRRSYIPSVYFQLISYESPYVNISFPETWDVIGQKLTAAYNEYNADYQALAAVVWRICGVNDSKLEQAKTLYDFVRDSVGTLQDPSSPLLAFLNKDAAALLDSRAGVIDEKNLLLAGLLGVCGIKTAPILFPTRDFCSFEVADFQLQQFNRLACYIEVDGESFILDAGDPAIPFPYCPPEDLVNKGLLLAGPRSRPVQLSPQPRESGVVVRTTIAATQSNTYTFQSDVMLRGYDQNLLGALILDSTAGEQFVRRIVSPDCGGYDLTRWTFTRFDSGDSSLFTITAEAHERQSEDSLGSIPLFPARLIENPFTDTDRQSLIDFQYERSVVHETIVRFPEDCRASLHVEDSTQYLPGMRSVCWHEQSDDTLFISQKTQLPVPLLAQLDYRRLKTFMESVIHTLDGNVTVACEEE